MTPGRPPRPPAVAGAFYPAAPSALAREVETCLAAAHAPLGPRPIVLIAPHAGYAFCGRVLGEAWAQAAPHAWDTLVVLGTNHSEPGFDRVSVWSGGDWCTPLGRVGCDRAAAGALLAAAPGDCLPDERCHLDEHSIEVQLPFAQRLFPGLPLLALVVATTGGDRLARFADALAGWARERRALIVASSDLSHYPAARDAAAVDARTLEAIVSLDPARLRRTLDGQMELGIPGLATCACGEAPILAAMEAARRLGAVRGTVLARADSSEGPRVGSRGVVGYGAVAFHA